MKKRKQNIKIGNTSSVFQILLPGVPQGFLQQTQELALKIHYDDFGSDYESLSRTAVTSKVVLFVIIVNGFRPLIIITKSSTLDVAAVLDPSLSRDEWRK